MARSSWKKCAAVALLASACSSAPGSPGTGGAGGAGAGGAGTAGAGGAGAGGSGGASSVATGGGAGDGGAGDGGAGGGGAGGAPEYACASLGDPCTTCLALRCQESYCACQRSAECDALANCFLGCATGDEPCRQTCMTAHEAGISDVLLEGGCAAERCDAQCPSRAPLSPCGSCLHARCAAEMNACVADPVCRELLACTDACAADDADCPGVCAMLYESGAPAAAQVFACEGAQCSVDCEER